MPLDVHARRLLDMVAAGRRDERVAMSAASLRESMRRLAAVTDVRHVPVARVEDRDVPSAHGPIPVRIYTPCATVAEPAPCIVYFHGGTGVFCDLTTHDGLCRMLAQSSGCRVISVAYRLAPEHPFPAAIDDGLCVTNWIADHASELDIDGEGLVIAGDSAGATIAAVLCQLALKGEAPPIRLQVLLCPVTDLANESESRRVFAEGYFIERTTLEWAKPVYLGGAAASDPRVSPLLAPSFAALPPAHIHTAEFDPMRDEGKEYADALTAAGVAVRYTCHAGLIHHFYCMAGAIPRARAVLASIGADIRSEITR